VKNIIHDHTHTCELLTVLIKSLYREHRLEVDYSCTVATGSVDYSTRDVVVVFVVEYFVYTLQDNYVQLDHYIQNNKVFI